MYWLLLVFACSATDGCGVPATVYVNQGPTAALPYERVVYPTYAACRAAGAAFRNPEAGGAAIKSYRCDKATREHAVWSIRKCTTLITDNCVDTSVPLPPQE